MADLSTEVTEAMLEGADGLRLAATIVGPEQGFPVILLHGGGQTRHAWAKTGLRLARAGYRITSYDARGHGHSDWSPEKAYSVADHARDLEYVLTVIGKPVALVGASMGGITSLQLATRSDIMALVLVDIVPKPALDGVRKIREFMARHLGGFADLGEAAAAVAAYNPARPPSADPQGLMRNLRLAEDGRLYWLWDPAILEGPMRPESAFEELASAIVAPTLLVRGAASDVVDAAGQEDLLRLIPHARVADVAGAGHMVAGDKNDLFASAIIDFLGSRRLGKASRDS